MSRPNWKLNCFNKIILLKIFKIKTHKSLKDSYGKLFIFNKSQNILKSLTNISVNIYKGNLYRRLVVNKYLIGYKFGQFTHTRKPYTYVIKKNTKNNLKR